MRKSDIPLGVLDFGKLMSRRKIDYLKVISCNGLSFEFDRYCFKHKDISLRRNAYNFVRSHDCIRTGINSLIKALEIAESIDTSQIGDVVYGEPKGRPF